MLNKIKVSIIIVNWNVGTLLKKCLESIFTSHPVVSFKVIVIDNASTDGTLQMINVYRNKLRLVVNKHNLGFSRAINQGIDVARGDYILLLNPDTVVAEGSIDGLVQFMEKKQKNSVNWIRK